MAEAIQGLHLGIRDLNSLRPGRTRQAAIRGEEQEIFAVFPQEVACVQDRAQEDGIRGVEVVFVEQPQGRKHQGIADGHRRDLQIAQDIVAHLNERLLEEFALQPAVVPFPDKDRHNLWKDEDATDYAPVGNLAENLVNETRALFRAESLDQSAGVEVDPERQASFYSPRARTRSRLSSFGSRPASRLISWRASNPIGWPLDGEGGQELGCPMLAKLPFDPREGDVFRCGSLLG